MENKRHVAREAADRRASSLQKKLKGLTAAVIALAVAVVGLGAWAVFETMQNAKLKNSVPEAAAQTVAAEPVAAQPVETSANAEAVVAEFDGGVVTAGEAAEQYEMLTTYYRLLGIEEADFADEAKQEVVDGLIEEKVLENKAKEMGCFELTDDQKTALEAAVQQEYEDNIAYYQEFRFDAEKSEEQIREETVAFLNENGLSYDELLTQAEQSAWRDSLYDAVTKDMTIDDAQLREFYDNQVTSDEMTYSASFSEYELDADAGRTIVWHPEGVRRIDTILIPFDEDQMTAYIGFQSDLEEGEADRLGEMDALFAELMPTAQEVKERLNAGESFETLRAEYDTMNASGCFVGAQSQLYGDDFRDAAMALQNVGDCSEPVCTDLGVCILRYADDVTPGTVDFESVKEVLRENYEQEIKSTRYNETVTQWIADANVVYHLENF